MNDILRGLRDMEGVHGALVVNAGGQILAYEAQPIYDAQLLDQVSRAIVTALDSVKLLNEDWESISAQFSDGRLLIRNLAASAKTAGLTLSVIADNRMNPSFAIVAVRVAVQKLRSLFDSGMLPGPSLSASTMAQAPALGSSLHAPVATASSIAASNPAASTSKLAPAEVASTGLSWSGLGTSSVAASGVAVVDAPSSAALTACTKALARAVGPMAKLFVKEAVRKLCAGAAFSKQRLPELVAELEKHIEDPTEAVQFRKSALKGG